MLYQAKSIQVFAIALVALWMPLWCCCAIAQGHQADAGRHASDVAAADCHGQSGEMETSCSRPADSDHGPDKPDPAECGCESIVAQSSRADELRATPRFAEEIELPSPDQWRALLPNQLPLTYDGPLATGHQYQHEESPAPAQCARSLLALSCSLTL